MATVMMTKRLLRNAKTLRGALTAAVRTSLTKEALSLAGKAIQVGKPHTVVVIS